MERAVGEAAPSRGAGRAEGVEAQRAAEPQGEHAVPPYGWVHGPEMPLDRRDVCNFVAISSLSMGTIELCNVVFAITL